MDQENKLQCKICNQDSLAKFISFGKMPVANAYVKKPTDLEYSYEMEVGFCKNCKMVQLINIVPYNKYIIPDETGKTHYAFFSSTSKFMEKHFEEIAREIEQKFLDQDSRVLEIGSNDGIFLKNFKNHQIIGVEPSQNVAELAINKGIPTTTEFFTKDLADRILLEKGSFRTIFSANVTLNIIDLNDFIKGIVTLLDEKGVFITEEPYILDILEKGSYDQIYDEHIWYFSLNSLSNLFSMHGLEIFDAEKKSVHGGSMRAYVCKPGIYKKTERLKKYLEEELARNINSIQPYLEFAKKVEVNKQKLFNLLNDLKSQGKKIVGYGAASKGTIIQNYCNLDNKLIDYISDSTPFKQGLYTPGKNIPIVSPDKFHNDNDKPDYAFLFAWNHAEEILEKETNFIEKGGKFIIPFPELKIIPLPLKKVFTKRIPGIKIKKLNVFANDQGYLFETLRNDDRIFDGKFGQVLVSEVYPGIVKGLHRHKKQTDYTTCIKGNIKYIAIKEINGELLINTFVIGEKNPILIKVPPGIWHGYTPVSNEPATVLHTMDFPYNTEDSDTDRIDPFKFGDFWTAKHG